MDVESLLGISSIYLFGRRLDDITLTKGFYENVPPKSNGANSFLRQQLEAEGAGFARIFAFVFEGQLVELGRPSIFLVHGGGFDPDDPPPKNAVGQTEFRRLARSPGWSSATGLGVQDSSFALGMKVWIYDKTDMLMRLDVETGPLEQILSSLDTFGPGESSSGVMARSSGGMARSSGGMARSSGGMARSSGGMARSSGWRPRRDNDPD